MFDGHKILKSVYEAKTDSQKADDFIRSYIPFIRSEASKAVSRQCTEHDDEYSIAMMAFYEAIMSYERFRGAFLPYASTVIKSRLIDYNRKESRHKNNISLYQETSETDERELIETIPDKTDNFEALVDRQATQQEIQELSRVMKDFGISFSDVADNCPKQERTLKSCGDAIRYAADNKELLDLLLRPEQPPYGEDQQNRPPHEGNFENYPNQGEAMPEPDPNQPPQGANPPPQGANPPPGEEHGREDFEEGDRENDDDDEDEGSD